MQVGLAEGCREDRSLVTSPDPQAPRPGAVSSLLVPAKAWLDRNGVWAPTWVPLSCLSLHQDWQLHESRALVYLGPQCPCVPDLINTLSIC